MTSKYVIFVVVAITAQRFLVLGAGHACDVSSFEIEVLMKEQKYGEEISNHGLERSCQRLFDKERAVLYENALGHHNKFEDSYSERSALHINGTVSTFMDGISPTLYALKTVDPSLDVPSSEASALKTISSLVEYIYQGIKLTQGQHSPEKLAEIRDLEAKVQAGGVILIGSFFNAIHNSQISPETDALVTCIEKNVTPEIARAFQYIFEGIYILWDALSKGSSANSEHTLHALAAAERKAVNAFKAEIAGKFAAIRIVMMTEYLNKTGIAAGLYAILSSDYGRYL